MRKFKKAVACATAAGLMICGAACGKTSKTDTLVIEAFDGGYGVQWVYDLVDAYKAKYPEKKVEIRQTTSYDAGFLTALSSGTSATDLYFGRESMRKYMLSKTVVNGEVYDSLIADLTSVYDSVIPGENVTVKEKINASAIKNCGVEDENGDVKYYEMPWVSVTGGIIRNKKVWKNGWKIPNTTNELITLCDTIKADGCIPMTYCLQDSYWYFPCETWVAQYQGVAGMYAFWDGYDENGERYTPEIMLTGGLLKAYEVTDALLKNENGYMDPMAKTADFTSVQTRFLETENQIAMIPNGDWIQREMSANYSPDEVDIEFIKTPVVSSIIEKCPSIENDKELSALIAAIDRGEIALSGEGYEVAQKDFDKVKEARGVYSTFLGHTGWVPAYSKKVDLAKDFLLYMASDEAIRVFNKATGGCAQPYEFDYFADAETSANMGNFMKNSYKIQKEGIPMGRFANTDRIFCVGGLKMYGNKGKFETYFSASNPADYMNAEAYFNFEYEYVKSRWNNFMAVAGLQQ